MERRFCVRCKIAFTSINRSKFCPKCRFRPRATGALIHFCHDRSLNEPKPAKCKCKKRVNDAELKQRLEHGEIALTDNGEYCWVGKRKATPRSASIEKSHIEYSAISTKTKDNRLTEEQIQKLLHEREETRLSFEEEARVRWEIHHELDLEMLRAITVEVPEIKDFWEGRAIFASGIGKDAAK
jgi:hypothetical protein